MLHPKLNRRKRGFFTLAQNTDDVDYVRLAYALALSLRTTQKDTPFLSIGVTPKTNVPKQYAWAFDNIIEIPWGDHAEDSDWKLENEWKVIHMSPYEETIKLDCDMLFFNDIETWWELMAPHDFYICNRVLNYRAETVTSDYYRKVFTENKLPNIYTGFTYFKKTKSTFELFKLFQSIFFNWQAYFGQCLDYRHRPTRISTDVAMALAIKLLDLDQTWYYENYIPTFTHMKTQLQNWNGEELDEDWAKSIGVFFNEDLECKIGNYLQVFPLHYYRKDFITDEIIQFYEKVNGSKKSMG